MPVNLSSPYLWVPTPEQPRAAIILRGALRLAVMIICLLPPWAMISEAALAREPSPLNIRQIHSGHSLTDTAAFKGIWPGHLQAMINIIQPNAAQIGKSTIPGSPMRWRWDNAPCCGDPDARADIVDWELLVITEGVPLPMNPEWLLESNEWLRTWVEHAWENGNRGNGAPTLLYTTWTQLEADPAEPHPEDHLPFRTRLDLDQPRWEDMADYAAANLPEAATVYIIPGNRLMMGLYDDIQAGLVPGVSDISDFFADSIHPNGLGSYAIALLHLAVLHHVDPRGLPHSGYGLSPEPSPALAAYLQDKVWNVAISYARTGLTADEEVPISSGTAVSEASGVGTSLELNNVGAIIGPIINTLWP